MFLDKPESKPKVKWNLDSGMSSKVTQYDPLYLISSKKQVDSKRENTGESNMFKEIIIKEIFKSPCESE